MPCWTAKVAFTRVRINVRKLNCHQYGVNNYCVLCTVKAKKTNKNIQQRTLSGLITIPLY